MKSIIIFLAAFAATFIFFGAREASATPFHIFNLIGDDSNGAASPKNLQTAGGYPESSEDPFRIHRRKAEDIDRALVKLEWGIYGSLSGGLALSFWNLPAGVAVASVGSIAAGAVGCYRVFKTLPQQSKKTK